MDWSLGHRDVKEKSHFLLRNELAYFKDAPRVYYLASVANVLLRFSWVIYLTPHPSTPVQGYIIALAEAARRIMWNTLRVEAEHIGNRGAPGVPLARSSFEQSSLTWLHLCFRRLPCHARSWAAVRPAPSLSRAPGARSRLNMAMPPQVRHGLVA